MAEKQRNYHDKYYQTHQARLDTYVIPELGAFKPSDIKRGDIDNWPLKLTKPNGKRLSGATKNKIASTMNIVFEELADLEILETNPLTGLKPFNQAPEKPRGAIDRESIQRLSRSREESLRVWRSPLWASMMLAFKDTGGRPGEVRALTWGDIDIQKRFAPIRKGIARGTADKVKGTKTGAVKAGFLTARTIQELALWRSISAFQQDEDFVFTMIGRAPVTNRTVLRAFRRGLKQAGIDNDEWTPYWLRHTFGTYQMEVLERDEIRKLMGHITAATTRIYQHPDDQTLYRATESIQEKLDRAREEG